MDYQSAEPALPESADVRIVATLETVRASDGERQRERANLRVDLCGDVCIYNESDCDAVLDFARQRQLWVFRARGRYRGDSLYPVVAFRASELLNRTHILADLDAEAARYPWLPALFAHQLSIGRGGDDELSRSWAGDELRWHLGEHLLFTHSRRLTRLAPAHARAFTRFARYHLRGHPVILAYLQELAGLPERMTWIQHGPGEVQTQILTIDGVARAPVSRLDAYRLDGLTREPSADDPWSVAIHEAMSGGELGKRRADQQLVRALDAARAQGQHDEAVLLCLEHAMQNGPLPPGIDSLEPFMADPGAQAVMACVVGQQQIKSDADAHTLIRSFRALRGHFTAREHVLMSFEANLLASIKDFARAEILYREILARNPYLTGVYKDLGDLFASRFDMDRAWRCWDLARQLCPQHPRLVAVERFEAKLRAAHDEYF